MSGNPVLSTGGGGDVLSLGTGDEVLSLGPAPTPPPPPRPVGVYDIYAAIYACAPGIVPDRDMISAVLIAYNHCSSTPASGVLSVGGDDVLSLGSGDDVLSVG